MRMPKNIFITSDTHFHHANIIGYCNRPFSSVEEMDEILVQRWNETVKPGDKVYHLGDVYMKKRDGSILRRLNGTKVLVIGNHDVGKDKFLHECFSRIYAWRFLKEHKLLLTHVPIHESSVSPKVDLNVHGHIHEKPSPPGPYRNACVEVNDYRPQPIESFTLR
jgi:calcineurin-like phosphoesterase family protein